MTIATAVTNDFSIGMCELRIGPMSSANKLTQANSVGILANCTVRFNQESVDLEAGLPKKIIDTAIVRNAATIEASAYEYSRKNIKVALGAGIESGITEASGVLKNAPTVSGIGTQDLETTCLLADVAIGDLFVTWPVGSPEKISVVRATAVAAGSPATEADITIDNTKTPLLFAGTIGDPVYKANQIGLGANQTTNYFSAQVVSLDKNSGWPIGFNFWKVAIGSGLEYGFSSDNFAQTPMAFKVLEPAASEYGVGQPLVHIAEVVPTHPFGMFYRG